MFDFPDTPTLNQTVTGSNGCLYRWDGVKWAASSSIPDVAANNVGRNLIHNSMFNIQQRGTGPWTAIGYTADRWLVNINLDTTSISLLALSSADRLAIGDEALRYCLAATFTGNAGAGSYSILIQAIEGVRRLAGKTITVSFWAIRSSGAAPNISVGLSQVYGTGGSPSAPDNVNAVMKAISGSWARYSFTLNVPSSSGKTYGTNNNDRTELYIWLSSGSNFSAQAGGLGVQSGGIYITGVQLEIGSVATPLEKIDPQIDLANCQRFYQAGDNVAMQAHCNAGAWLGQTIRLPVTMRATPTYNLSGMTYTNASGAAVTNQTNTGTFVYAVATATGQTFFSGVFNASADL